MKIGYVVLHYQSIKETHECVESIINILTPEDCIIVVDNCSPNNSGEQLARDYKENRQIDIIFSTENVGFAKGNNLGFYRAKYKYKSDFIVLLNNDIIIRQNNFREILLLNYQKYGYDIVGPKVLQKNGKVNSSTPSIPLHTSLQRARVGQLSNFLRLVLSYINADIVFSNVFDKRNTLNNDLFMSYHEDVQISGCCIIFSKRYIETYDGLNDNTFMYLEEILLYIRAKKEKMKIAYDPDLEVINLEDAATNEVFKGRTKEKRQFKYRCQMKSFKVLIAELKSEQANEN